jgi:periplasmic protein CpxP/Spy
MLKHSKTRSVMVTIAILVVASLAWVGVILAQGQAPAAASPMGGGRGMVGHMMMGRAMVLGRVARQLGLTDAQKQDIKAVIQGHKADFQALAQKAMPVHQQLRAAIQSNDEAAIQNLSGELGQVAVDRAVLAARVHQEVFAKLTPDQRAKAAALLQQFQARRQARLGAGK